MNAHRLRHYVYFVRRFGPLWVYSCFGFETMNGCLTNMIHGTKHIAEQVYYYYHCHYHYFVYLHAKYIQKFCLTQRTVVERDSLN